MPVLKTNLTCKSMRRLLTFLFLLMVICTTASCYVIYQTFMVPIAPETPVIITINNGSSLQLVARQLELQGVIRHSLSLRTLARIDQQSGHIQAGTYKFSEPALPAQIMSRLIEGDVEKVQLTVPEGFTLEQIIERIAQSGYGNGARLRQLSHDPAFIKTVKVEASSLEGYLFPETYSFAPGIDEKALLRMLVNQFWQNLSGELKQTAQKQGMNVHQLTTLASIIEKETGLKSEMPTISSVFHNRLKRNIPLQTDPTVIYGIKDFNGNLTRKHLRTPGPYNTYLNRGLPPGPIANPGLAALLAAAHPANTKYLYFVARGDGSHQFSRTLKEHNAAVRKYQLRRRSGNK